MNLILNYFLKKYSFNSNIENFRAKTLLLFLLVGLSLLVVFMIKTIISEDYSSLFIQSVFLFIILGSLILIKAEKHIIVRNSLPVVIILIEIISIFFNFSGAAPFNFFVDEFYLLLAFLVFTSMFACKTIVILNTVLIIGTSITAFIYKKNSFPLEIIDELTLGLSVYILVVIVIFIFSFLYTHTIFKAIKEISDSTDDTKEKNILLEEKNKLLSTQKTELILTKEKAEESDKLKTTFLANMSHEIRTPMNAILGFTEILNTTKLDDKQFEYINIIKNRGNHLLQLINDIIDISKFDTNEIKYIESKCNINILIKDLVKYFKLIIEKDGKSPQLQIIASCGLENGNETLLTDNKRLRQILTNLISNSIKFTASGTIKVSYSKYNENELLFSVKDTGIGIEEDLLPIIFNHFRQADESNTRKFGGTGLGLAISIACIDILDGKIWLESELDKGSEFFFTIPYKSA